MPDMHKQLTLKSADKWRDFLRPLVEAAVTALAVYAAGAQHASTIKKKRGIKYG